MTASVLMVARRKRLGGKRFARPLAIRPRRKVEHW
ncbi:hypothetical protein NK6_2502 [Bradyrhizobium diazoefficiens]|uniref:Uncharacterized protein n=1 Tax=Bradyrhizobium diazoefficiens TaxID=1355477 RepID=A0A0E4BM49_9BRAD|nr:hypothetical protein NK6_2502 [Bradyrhizobium diazoefficiens]